MRIVALLSTVVVLACAGSTPTTTDYLLRSPAAAQSGRVDAPLKIGLEPVLVAPYLDRAGIVVETESGQVRAARHHRWAEPLADGLRSYLRSEISAALGYEVSASQRGDLAWAYSIEVEIERLHGTMGGSAMMDASYRITRRGADAAVVEYRFRESTPLPREGYPGVVDAEAALAGKLARSIASALQNFTGS